MTLAERLSEYVRACFTGLWIRTHEPDDALAEVAGLCRDQGWSLATWDVDRGLAVAGRAETSQRRGIRRRGGQEAARPVGGNPQPADLGELARQGITHHHARA